MKSINKQKSQEKRVIKQLVRNNVRQKQLDINLQLYRIKYDLTNKRFTREKLEWI